MSWRFGWSLTVATPFPVFLIIPTHLSNFDGCIGRLNHQQAKSSFFERFGRLGGKNGVSNGLAASVAGLNVNSPERGARPCFSKKLLPLRWLPVWQP